MNPELLKIQPFMKFLLGCPCTVTTHPDKAATKITGVHETYVTVDRTNGYPNNIDHEYVRPLLRMLEDLTEEELTELAVLVFNVPPHIAYLDIADIKKFLCDNTTFYVGTIPDEDEMTKPIEEFELTPQTFFNLTHWLLDRYFDLFGLIPNDLADHTILHSKNKKMEKNGKKRKK